MSDEELEDVVTVGEIAYIGEDGAIDLSLQTPTHLARLEVIATKSQSGDVPSRSVGRDRTARMNSGAAVAEAPATARFRCS